VAAVRGDQDSSGLGDCGDVRAQANHQRSFYLLHEERCFGGGETDELNVGELVRRLNGREMSRISINGAVLVLG